MRFVAAWLRSDRVSGLQEAWGEVTTEGGVDSVVGVGEDSMGGGRRRQKGGLTAWVRDGGERYLIRRLVADW